MKNIVAVCDREAEYAHRLMDYMNRKKSFIMKAAAFSRENSILKYGSENKIDLLIISENMLNERTSAINARKKLVLKESRHSDVCRDIPNIYKYQSADAVVKEVMSSYEAENLIFEKQWRDRKRIIGVYTPVGGSRKTSFALTLGQALSRQSAVLYINMEGFSGFEEILGMRFESGLSDLLYYLNRSDVNTVSKLSSMTVSIQNMDLLPPVHSPEDLKNVKSSKWLELFSAIMSGSAYEALVLDIGNEIEDIADILNFCSVIYMPVREDPLAKARTEDFLGYIKANGVDTEKIKKLKLPFNTTYTLGKDYYEKLEWSELGDYTRQLLKKDMRS